MQGRWLLRTIAVVGVVAVIGTACSKKTPTAGPSSSQPSVATSPTGLTAGPFMASIPTPPSTAWGPAYAYATAASGTFTISAAGDGATVTAP